MKILITGATGLVGTEIQRLCQQQGHFVHYLSTNKSKIKETSNSKGFYWDPQKGTIDKDCLQEVKAIIHLAGASVSKKWTDDYKRTIEQSRIKSIKLLYQLLNENKHQVKVFSTAYALGVYPSSYSKKYSETFKDINDTFLGQVIHKVELEADKFSKLQLSVSKLRIGIVLANNGGALVEMAKPVRFGLGAALGTGKQYMSWIHLTDLASMFLYAVENDLSGPYNAVASNPVSNLAMTKAIAKVLNRPLWLPKIPSFVLKLMLGEMSTIVLESQYLVNDKIKNKGFKFQYDDLHLALKDCLK